MIQTRNLRPLFLFVAFAIAAGLANAQVVVSDFSNFSESGNLLSSPNTREQTFTPSNSSVTVTNTSGSDAGQEAYLSNGLPTLATGERMTVSLTSATFGPAADTIGLAIASTEALTSRENVLVWGWRSNTMYLTNFDGGGGNTSQLSAFPASGRPDSVFIERTATGWTLGSIRSGVETIHYTDITTVGSTDITADGSAIGLWSDMRDNNSTWTVSEFSVGVPDPRVVRNFSNFSESGNLLTGTNSREQTFTPTSPSVAVTHGGSGSGVGQETYLSDEFSLLVLGDRISVDLASGGSFNQAPETIALAICNTETPTTRADLLVWGWRSGTMFVGNFDGSGSYVGESPAFPASGVPDSVFIERTATGWTLGSIKGGIEAIFYTGITAVGSSSITADGTAIGLFSDMRTDASTWTVRNLAVGAPNNNSDSDDDDLLDAWEILHFRTTTAESEADTLAKFDGDDDPDEDTFDNEAEETAGTDPNDPAFTPVDTDGDGNLDSWELTTFGTIAFGPADDPDGDGWTTAQELSASTDPANSASSPVDTDVDGLADADETFFFGGLGQEPLNDFDGDGVSNHGELAAGFDPTDPGDYPLVSFVPVNDGNAATDENGYAGSATNSIAFLQDNLVTVGGQQFIAYYRRHASDAADSNNQSILIARRNVDDIRWEVFSTPFILSIAEINNTHNVISFAIDGDGFLHISWGMHSNVHGVIPLRYAKSSSSVLGTGPISMVAGTMTGQENTVTYPKFVTLPDGDLLYLFREGGSGNGDWYLNRYDTESDTWAPLHANGSGVHQPFMKGTGDSPSNCFYPDRMTLGPDGMLHLAGPFRDSAGSVQSNHRYVYLRSPDQGVTWQRTDNSVIDLPAVERAGFAGLSASHLPEIIEDFPQGYSIMNESGMTTDSAGHPIIANWWADDAGSGDQTRQYHIFFHDGSTWQKRVVSARDIDNPSAQYGGTGPSLASSFMGRPVVLTDADDRIIVLYNDNRFPGITAVFSEPLAQDPGRNRWTRINLTSENLGRWEGTYDEARWKQDGVLQMLYQKLPGSGVSYTAQNNSTPVSVLDWNARAYFGNPIYWIVDTSTTPGQASVMAPTRTGFRYDLRTSTDLDFSAPPAAVVTGDGTWQDFGTWQMNELRRFWRLERTEEATDDL